MSRHIVRIAVLLVLGCAPDGDPGGSTESEPGPTASSLSIASATVDPTSTSGPPPTTSATTEEGTPSTTAASPFCGDDNLDLGEECDLGRDNSNTGPCTLMCTKAKCGDSLIWESVEECDLGRDNSNTGPCTLMCKKAKCGDDLVWENVEECDLGRENDDKYGGCTPTCARGPYCGDGVLDIDHEDCDLGDLNGETKTPSDGKADCTTTCQWRGRVVFLSSAFYDGKLGGRAGADDKCNALATSAGIVGKKFMAWLSVTDPQNCPAKLFVGAVDIPYIHLDGTIVAADFPSLVKDGLIIGISITEKKEDERNKFVWTDTDLKGEMSKADQSCSDWTSSSGLGRIGQNRLEVESGTNYEIWKKNSAWTEYASLPCSSEYRLYCFEQ